ncbi:hypothetical protein ACOCJ5_07485 [Knoellia sp. CPCC 206450]|uniref:hypothetical protein n=1 Tax=Knoellia tibetensis TaxID=3404798 RepID=UPI003B43CF65
MSCDGIHALDPLCQAAELAQGATGTIADSAFTQIAGYFGTAATGATSWLWEQIDAATTLDLRSPTLATEMGATAAIAAVLCLGLFLVQIMVSAIRGHPASLGRALTGLLVSFLGSAFALATTRVLLGAVDSLSDGFVRYTLDTNVAGLGEKMAFFELATIHNPAATILISLVVLAAVVIVWAAMMMRKLMLVLAAVMAPLAFSGATADFTRGWVRRWIEFVAAMIVSKLLLVIIFSVGISVLNGAGKQGTGAGQVSTQLAGGTVILLLGGLAPWVAIRMFHFAGDTLHAAYATTGQAAAGGRTVISAPQKFAAVKNTSRSLIGYPGSSSAAGRGSGVRTLPASRTSPPPPPAGPGAVGGSGAAGTAASGGAAAASAAVVPALAVAGTAAAVKGATSRAVAGVESAQTTTNATPPSAEVSPVKPPRSQV